MLRPHARWKTYLFSSAVGLGFVLRPVLGGPPENKQLPPADNGIRLVQERPAQPGPGTAPGMAPGTAPGTAPGMGTETAPTTPAPSAGAAPSVAGTFSPPSAGQTPRESAGATPTSSGAISVAGGQSQPRAALDTGDFLAKSQEATAVEIQRRSPVISDPRIRGYRIGQVVTLGDGAFFFPARQDLDTAVSKIDSSILRDVIIFKGPYTASRGPGFAFIDVATFDPLLATKDYQHGPEYHGRTGTGYQTNGERLDALQAFWGGDHDWAFFVSYGLRVGNDYEAGNDYRVPSSYNSQPWNFAVGVRLTQNSFIEFHGLHLDMRNIEFAGLYFDINRLTTDAESIHYEIDNQDYFNRFALDVWYNRTAADGDTHQGAKQVFLTNFLTQSFFPDTNVVNGIPLRIEDRSSTNFYEKSRGYRATLGWGDKNCTQVSVGSDLNYLSQQLQENIVFTEAGGNPVPIFNGAPAGTQNLGIPNAHLVDPGIFAEATIPWGKRVKLRTGVRGDWVETNSGPRLVSGTVPLFFNQPPGGFGSPPVTSFNPIIFSSQPGNPDLRNEYFLWSAFVDLSYQIDEHWTVAGQFGYAMRPPTPTDLYATGPFIAVLQQGLDRLYGDPHLAPERAYQMEFDVRGNYAFLRAGVSGFYSWINDYITFDANSLGTSSRGPISQVVFTNTDLATLAGGEAFLEVDVTDWLATFANLTYVQGWDRTHIDNRRSPDLVSSRRSIPQEPLPFIPPLEGRVGLRVHESISATRRQPRWSVESYVRLVNHQHYVAGSLGEQTTPGFAVWDLRSYWQVLDAKGHPSPRNPGLLLTAGVENIGNRFYREHLDPRAGFPTDLLFRPGTNVYVGAQLEY